MHGVLGNCVYRRDEGVLARRIAGESVLVPIRGELAKLSCIFALDPVGEFIWEQLDGRGSLSEIAGLVGSTFDVDPSRAEADLLDFVAALRAEELVAEVESRETA